MSICGFGIVTRGGAGIGVDGTIRIEAVASARTHELANCSYTGPAGLGSASPTGIGVVFYESIIWNMPTVAGHCSPNPPFIAGGLGLPLGAFGAGAAVGAFGSSGGTRGITLGFGWQFPPGGGYSVAGSITQYNLLTPIQNGAGWLLPYFLGAVPPYSLQLFNKAVGSSEMDDRTLISTIEFVFDEAGSDSRSRAGM